MIKYLRQAYSIARPLVMTGILAITGCADTITRTEYEAARKKDEETAQMIREQLTAADSRYEKALTDLKKLVTERTSIPELMPLVGKAKADILEQLQKDYNDLTEKLKTEGEKLERTRRTTVSDLEQQKRWFEQTAKPAIGNPESAEKPADGVYKDRIRIDNHDTRLANQKKAFHDLEQNLVYHRTVQEWSYSIYVEFRNNIELSAEDLQKKIEALNSAKPEERATALETFERDVAIFEKKIENLYQQQKEKRKKVPPRPGEKND